MEIEDSVYDKAEAEALRQDIVSVEKDIVLLKKQFRRELKSHTELLDRCKARYFEAKRKCP